MNAVQPNLIMVSAMARLLEGRRHVLVGTNAPVQAAAALLARLLSEGGMRLTMLGSRRHSFLTEDLGELFESAARGVFDAFFVGGGQIDGRANVNLVGLGDYPVLSKRWPGSHGTPLLYMMIPNIILAPRGRHDRRTLVDRVDFISAPGISPPEVFRPGGPIAMVTERCVFSFDRERSRFRLETLHPGQEAEDVRRYTGFAYEEPAQPTVTPPTGEAVTALLRDQVCAELATLYPRFAATLEAELGVADA